MENQKRFWEFHERTLEFLLMCETIKIPITYKDIGEMLMPEYTYTAHYVGTRYQTLIKETEKSSGRASARKPNAEQNGGSK